MKPFPGRYKHLIREASVRLEHPEKTVMVGKLSTMRGRGQSTRPVSKRPPNWVIYQPDEVKALIINLAREGRTQSQIGNILRDIHGIPLVKPITHRRHGHQEGSRRGWTGSRDP
jgi:hypothetical protein